MDYQSEVAATVVDGAIYGRGELICTHRLDQCCVDT